MWILCIVWNFDGCFEIEGCEKNLVENGWIIRWDFVIYWWEWFRLVVVFINDIDWLNSFDFFDFYGVNWLDIECVLNLFI